MLPATEVFSAVQGAPNPARQQVAVTRPVAPTPAAKWSTCRAAAAPRSSGSAFHCPNHDATFDDDRGRHWTVEEIDCGRLPQTSSARCLVIYSIGIAKRVRTYPRDWQSLLRESLVALLVAR